MTTAEGLVFVGLCFIPSVLTLALFITKERMLGYPAGIMWAILGGFCFTMSASTWDIFYLLGFACLLGMVTFTIYGAFALRERHDTIAEKELEKGEGGYVDEGKGDEIGDELGDEPKVSKRRQALRDRADDRRDW